MIKKIVLSVIALVIMGGIGYLIHISNQINKMLPDLMEGTKSIYIDSCENDAICINVIEDYFPECRLENYMGKINLLTFRDEYVKFMMKTHNCIDEKTEIDLPSFMDHIMNEKLKELE